MADKTKDAKKDDARMSSIAKTLNKVEDRLEKSENCDSVAEGLANAAKASELLSSVWTLPPTQLLRFHHDTKVSDIDGDSTPGFDGNKDDAERFISISSSEIARYQRLMYANGVKGSHRRLLIVLQGMDASGKGGIVRHVFSQGDPMGMHYHGFGAPKGEELAHDSLWRIKRELPNNGWISIFDRSHYEDIVMPRIYKTQPEEVWQARYDEINRFESQLTADGCAIIKIFLVVSKDEQKRHFLKARRTASTPGRCGRSSTIPMTTMIGPSPEPSIWIPHSRAAKSCSSTTAFPTDVAFRRHRLPRAARSCSCSSIRFCPARRAHRACRDP